MMNKADPLRQRTKAQHLRQDRLRGRARQQVFAPPYPICLKNGIVHDTGRLVTRPAIFFADNKVGHGSVEVYGKRFGADEIGNGDRLKVPGVDPPGHVDVIEGELAGEAVVAVLSGRQVFTGAGAGEDQRMTPEMIEGFAVLRQAVLLAPVIVEISRIGRAIRYPDPQPVDHPENVFKVGFAEAGAVEIIDAEQYPALLSGQEGIQGEVGGVACMQVAGGGGRQAGDGWRLAIGDI